MIQQSEYILLNLLLLEKYCNLVSTLYLECRYSIFCYFMKCKTGYSVAMSPSQVHRVQFYFRAETELDFLIYSFLNQLF